MAEHPPSANVGVAVMVTHQNKLLLMRRANSHGAGTWAMPGGHIDYGETPEAAAVREVREETGVTIADCAFRGISNDIFEAEHKHYITLWFVARYVAGEPRLNAPDEMSDVGWFDWEQLPQPLFLPLQHLLAGQTTPPLINVRDMTA